MRAASLCSGYGGLEMGVALIEPIEVAWHAEVDDAAARVHAHHWPDAPNLGDLTAIDWAACEPVDLICAGYPCQPFSTAGRRRGADDARHLWPHIAEAVRVLRPRRVLLENVRGHLSLGFGAVLGSLADMGYDARWGCVRASDAGAPHRRERVFIVATDATELGHERCGGSRRRWDGSADSGGATADTDGWRCQIIGQHDGTTNAGSEAPRRHDLDRLGPNWGAYAPAIERWERLTRPAPRPTDQRGRLAPVFVEWMMGLPEGHVTGHDLPRTAQLKMLGNGVVLQAAALAWSALADAPVAA